MVVRKETEKEEEKETRWFGRTGYERNGDESREKKKIRNTSR